MKRLNKGIPAAVLMNSGYHSNALAGEFDAILNSWRKAVTPFSQPKRLVSGRYEDGHWVELRLVWSEATGRYKIDPNAYEAKGRNATMAAAKMRLQDAMDATPAELQPGFEAVIDLFDGGYDWDWKLKETEPMTYTAEVIVDTDSNIQPVVSSIDSNPEVTGIFAIDPQVIEFEFAGADIDAFEAGMEADPMVVWYRQGKRSEWETK